MKKVWSIILTMVMLMSTVAVLPVMAEPASEYVFYASTSEEYSANTATFTTSAGTVGEKSTNSAVIDSVQKLGYNDKKAIALTESSTASPKYATWNLGSIAKGTYEVYYWNIPAVDDEEKYRATDTKPTASAEVFYDVIRKIGSSTLTSTYFVNPGMEAEGWVKIGDKFAFNGDGNDQIKVGKYADSANSYAYVSAIKLVPITQDGTSTELSHVYLEGGDNEYWATDVTGDDLRVKVPSGATWFTATVVSADPNARVQISGAAEKTGSSAFYLGGDTLSAYEKGSVIGKTVSVTSADGTATQTYRLAIDIEAEDSSAIVVNHETTSGGKAELIGTWASVQSLHGNLQAVLPSGATKVAHLEVEGYGAKYTPTVETAGWYNVYSYAAGDSYGQKAAAGQFTERELSVSVKHNGLTEEATVMNGGIVNAHNTAWKGGAWIYVGRYYFAAQEGESGTQSVTLSKLTASETSRAWLYGIKLVPTQANPLDKSMDGMTVTAGDKTVQILSEYADGYTQPLPMGDYTTVTVNVKTAVGDVEKITINEQEAVDNTATISVTDGENAVSVTLEKTDGSQECYQLSLYKLTGNWTMAALKNTGDALAIADRGADFTGSSLDYLKSGDMATVGVKPRNREGSAYTTEQTYDDGYYRVLIWKPALGSVKNAKYPVGTVTTHINTGYTHEYKSVNWSAQPSQWVDLGTHCMKFGNNSVEVGFKPEDGAALADLTNGFLLLKVNAQSGLDYAEVNSVPYTADKLNGMVLADEDGSVTIRPVTAKADDTVSINGQVWTSGTTMTYTATDEVKNVTIRVTSAEGETENEYTFTVLNCGTVENGNAKYFTRAEVDETTETVKGVVYYRSRGLTEQARVFLAQYAGEKCVKVTDPVVVYVRDGARKVETSAVSLEEGVDKVKVFLWDNFTDMTPVLKAEELVIQ